LGVGCVKLEDSKSHRREYNDLLERANALEAEVYRAIGEPKT
jgi:hypothetical protein